MVGFGTTYGKVRTSKSVQMAGYVWLHHTTVRRTLKVGYVMWRLAEKSEKRMLATVIFIMLTMVIFEKLVWNRAWNYGTMEIETLLGALS